MGGVAAPNRCPLLRSELPGKTDGGEGSERVGGAPRLSFRQKDFESASVLVSLLLLDARLLFLSGLALPPPLTASFLGFSSKKSLK